MLSLLCDKAFARDKVAVEAICELTSRCSRKELEAILNEHDQQLWLGALAALHEQLYTPEWMKLKDR